MSFLPRYIFLDFILPFFVGDFLSRFYQICLKILFRFSVGDFFDFFTLKISFSFVRLAVNPLMSFLPIYIFLALILPFLMEFLSCSFFIFSF